VRDKESRAFSDNLTYVKHHFSRKFIKIHELLLRVDRNSTLKEYLRNAKIKNL